MSLPLDTITEELMELDENNTPTSSTVTGYEGIRNICLESQTRIHALCQSFARQPGITSAISEGLNIDMRGMSQTFVAISAKARSWQEQTAELENNFNVLSDDLHTLQIRHRAAERQLATEREAKDVEIAALRQQLADVRAGLTPASRARGRTEPSRTTQELQLYEHLERVALSDNAARQRADTGTSQKSTSRQPPSAPRRPHSRSAHAAPSQGRSALNPEAQAFGTQALVAYQGAISQPESQESALVPYNPQPRRVSVDLGRSRHGTHRPGTAMTNRSSRRSHSSAAYTPSSHGNDESPEVAAWSNRFTHLFQLIQGWCHTYMLENLDKDILKSTVESNRELWSFICEVATCYKDKNAAGGHALFLFSHPEHRRFFVARMIMQYITNAVLPYTFWRGFSKATDTVLARYGPRSLAPVGDDQVSVSPEERGRSREHVRGVVAHIISSPSPSIAVREQLQRREDSTRMRELTAPFIISPGTAEHVQAGLDMQTILVAAGELGGAMLTDPRLTFKLSFDPVAVMFRASSHQHVNRLEMSAQEVEAKAIRVMLTVTPSVECLDFGPGGRQIRGRKVCKAQVLVMD